MSSFSTLRENLKIALMTTAIAAVTSVSFVEADGKAPVDAGMSERMNDILLLSGLDADSASVNENDENVVRHAPSKMSMKMQMMDLMLPASDTTGAMRSLNTVDAAYEALQEAEQALKAASIDMIVSEGYVLENPSSRHSQSILEQHQEEYMAARNHAETLRDRFVEEAHSAREKGADIGQYNDILALTKARDYNLVSLQDVEAAEKKLATQTRSCISAAGKWSCD